MDDFERELREMLGDRVASMEPPADPSPQLLTRARRRRAAKLTALAVSVVVVAGGTAGAIAQVARGDRPQQVITSTPTSTLPRPAVATVGCATDHPRNIFGTRVLPSFRPQVPTAGDPGELANLVWFAGSTDPKSIVLGPRSWSCHWPVGGLGLVVYRSDATGGRVPSVDDAPIAVENQMLWAPLAVSIACSVFDDPEVMHAARQANVSCASRRSPRRTVTRVDKHVATFVDANGDRGAGWLQLPSSESAADGNVSVLTCRPDQSLSVGTCATIVADYSARLVAAETPTVQCPAGSENGEPNAATGVPAAGPRVPASAGGSDSTLQLYSGGTDPRYDVLGPDTWSCLSRLTEAGSSMVVYDPNATPGQVPPVGSASIAIENEVWDDAAGVRLLCSVFDDSSVVASTSRNYPGSCSAARDPRRTVNRVGGDVATFVDANADRGAGWMLLPSPSTQDPGRISVLTCRPSAQLTVATCDTIIGDYVARLTNGSPPPTATTTTTTTTTLPGTVATTVCPMTYALTDHATAHPSSAPRVPAAGSPTLFSQLASFAADDDPRFVALGPTAWLCEGQMGADGDNAFVVYQTAAPGGVAPDIFTAPIAIENDWLWHGLSAITNLCKVSTDPAVIAQAAAESQPCAVPAGRTLTPVDAHSSTFVDADGSRGGAWFVLPSSTVADGDGKLSILTCRPTTDLTAAECDTIIADWLARNDTTG